MSRDLLLLGLGLGVGQDALLLERAELLSWAASLPWDLEDTKAGPSFTTEPRT